MGNMNKNNTSNKSKVRTYQIYRHPSGNIRAVKVGFSWSAAIVASIICFTILVIIGYDKFIGVAPIIIAIVAFAFGMAVNNIFGDSLIAKSYIKVNSIEAYSKEQAVCFLCSKDGDIK